MRIACPLSSGMRLDLADDRAALGADRRRCRSAWWSRTPATPYRRGGTRPPASRRQRERQVQAFAVADGARPRRALSSGLFRPACSLAARRRIGIAFGASRFGVSGCRTAAAVGGGFGARRQLRLSCSGVSELRLAATSSPWRRAWASSVQRSCVGFARRARSATALRRRLDRRCRRVSPDCALRA